ncbi:MAG: hypothetical protein AAFQ82_26150, partial [Myxococcota bacterium]
MTNVRPDAVDDERLLVVKAVEWLHLTTQLRLLHYRARKAKLRLEIRVAADTELSPDLQEYLEKHPTTI